MRPLTVCGAPVNLTLMAVAGRTQNGGGGEGAAFASFTRAMTWTAGGVGIAAAAFAVYLGLGADTILKGSDAELWLVAGITLVAAVFLAAPWRNPRIRAVGLAVCAVAYHVVLAGSWVTWIEHYNAHTALGTAQAAWQEAVALPLLMAAGLLLVAAALFAWPASRSLPTSQVSKVVRLS